VQEKQRATHKMHTIRVSQGLVLDLDRPRVRRVHSRIFTQPELAELCRPPRHQTALLCDRHRVLRPTRRMYHLHAYAARPSERLRCNVAGGV